MEKIIVEPYHTQYYVSKRGTQYRIINFYGDLKVYARGQRDPGKINITL